jgi:hypothetical protein
VVLRGPGHDAVVPLSVLVSWADAAEVESVGFTFRVPVGFSQEIVLDQPHYLLCTLQTAGQAGPAARGGTLTLLTEIHVRCDRRIPFGVKFQTEAGESRLRGGLSGEGLVIASSARLVQR